jgi:amino acid transporter
LSIAAPSEPQANAAKTAQLNTQAVNEIAPAAAECRVGAGLLPSLGLFTTIMMVVGGVIGSGIFRKPGVMAGQVGSPELLLGVWILAGVLTLFGALTNAEIASLIPETGGQYVYFERTYGPFFAFLYGWATFAVMQCGSIAAITYVFAEYASQFVRLPEFSAGVGAWSLHVPFIGDVSPLKEIGTKGLAAALIVLLTAINYVGVRFGGLVQNIFTVAKVAAMLLLVLGAFLLPTGGATANLTTPSTAIHLSGLALFAGIMAALQGAFWAYDGWNKLTYIAGEVKQPQRNIPLGLLWGMLIVTAVYLLINVAYAYGVFVLRRKQPDAPRPYKVPGYPVVPWIFILFALLYLVFTVYNDIVGYQAAVAAGKPALINSALGTALTLIGAPIYLFYRARKPVRA